MYGWPPRQSSEPSLPSLPLVAETRGSNKGTEPTAAGAGTALRNPLRENQSLVNSQHPESSNVMTLREGAVEILG